MERFASEFERLSTKRKLLIAGASRYGRTTNRKGWLFGPDMTHALVRVRIDNVPKSNQPIVFWCAYGKCTSCGE